MEDTNEFAVDTPEAHMLEESLNGAETDNLPVPEADDIDAEPSADQPIPPTPVVTAPVAATPVAPAAAQGQSFDRRTQIPGMKDSADVSPEGHALRTKELLSKQPKVRMMIPLDPGEKPGAYRTVIINGYRFDVRKNTMVDLPESVANLLAESYRITSDVVENNPLNLGHADERKRSALGV
mgnify:CR=1 FL=1